MPRFRFEAVNAEGVQLNGELDAGSDREAARALERRGLSVLRLDPSRAASPGVGRTGRLGLQDQILAFHELATMLHAGVALAEAVDAQARSAHHPRLVAAFESIAQGLRRGRAFSEALEASALPLPAYVPTLVRAGEQSGLLARALSDAVEQMGYDHAVRGEVRQALTYPAVLVLAGIGAILLMFVFVVPKFSGLLTRAQELPLLAWAVLGSGLFVRDNLLWLGLGLAALVGVALRWLADPARRALAQERLERLPVLGPWRIEAETASWAKVLATLLGNRVPLMDALQLSLDAVRSPARRRRLEEVARSVRGGMPLAEALEQQSALTATGYNLIRVGERSGELPAMLRSLAQLCQDAGRTRMKQFLALLEPLAILVIGSVIGVIMIGIILAITSVNDIAV